MRANGNRVEIDFRIDNSQQLNKMRYGNSRRNATAESSYPVECIRVLTGCTYAKDKRQMVYDDRL
jgi:hypothetical protein